MKRWYSKRGAWRGLKMAILAAALWSFWALGYFQGLLPAQQLVHTIDSAVSAQACCQPSQIFNEFR